MLEEQKQSFTELRKEQQRLQEDHWQFKEEFRGVSDDVAWCKQQMERLNKRMERVEKFCAAEPGVAKSEVVAVAASSCNAPTSGCGSPGVQSSGVVSIRKKPQEFDGKVSCEAYRIQFEMLADKNDWDEGQRAVQLATSLKGPALEVLGQLSKADKNRYSALVEVLERKYGTMAKGEPLQQLAQDLESTVHKAFPTAIPDLLSLLLKEQFIDALDSVDLKVQVKQTRPGTMQKALARALEFESYVKSSTGNFWGECWTCRKKGHMSYDCPTRNKESEN
uniref:CCHC-type domain-containing protein n=1 Tax=Octopus bimaculoides TaxID=37653 RepID=A0A0L8FXP0_OCTBM